MKVIYVHFIVTVCNCILHLHEDRLTMTLVACPTIQKRSLTFDDIHIFICWHLCNMINQIRSPVPDDLSTIYFANLVSKCISVHFYAYHTWKAIGAIHSSHRYSIKNCTSTPANPYDYTTNIIDVLCTFF